MAEDNPEVTGEPESEASKIRKLIISTARAQIEALGYADVITELDKWLNGNMTSDPGINDSNAKIQEFTTMMLKYLPSTMNVIPDIEERERLAVAAMSGLPAGRKIDPTLLLSYHLIVPNRIPPEYSLGGGDQQGSNVQNTQYLVGKVIDTGFVREGESGLNVITRRWGEESFSLPNLHRTLKLIVTPPSNPTQPCGIIVRYIPPIM